MVQCKCLQPAYVQFLDQSGVIFLQHFPFNCSDQFILTSFRQRWIPTQERGPHRKAMGLDLGVLGQSLIKNNAIFPSNLQINAYKIQIIQKYETYLNHNTF